MSEEGHSLPRGAKRKRRNSQTETKDSDISMKIAGKLHHHVKEVRKAAKKAKTFETQKIVKKLKFLRSAGKDPGDVTDLELELEFLKKLNCDLIADTALKTKIRKDRLLSGSDHFQAALSSELLSDSLTLTATDTPSSKIHKRLLSSKALATEVSMVVVELRKILHPEGEGEGDERVMPEFDEGKAKRIKKDEKVTATKIRPTLDQHVADSKDQQPTTHPSEELESEHEADADAGWQSGTVEDEGEDAADGWESGSVPEEPGGPDLVINSSDESGDDENTDEGPENRRVKHLPTKTDKSSGSHAKTKATPVQSTFLPSLAVGYTRGDSDESEWSDSDAKIADGEMKKNRRGQRARRAIWEKKFGKNANHMKKQRELEQTAGPSHKGGRGGFSGKALSKKAATSTIPARKGHNVPDFRQQKVDSGWSQRKGHSSDIGAPQPIVSIRSKDEKPLHPSWEAKKRLKERQSIGIVPSQGTKIKFS